MTPKQRFAQNLRDIRASSDLTQEEVSFRSGIHRTEVSRYELFDREPRLEAIIKLAAGLGSSLDDLCDGIAWDTELGEFSVSEPFPNH
jgi:transcriptional regulator with XRE-family HTH domain